MPTQGVCVGRIEKSLIRPARTKWIAPNKCYGIFFMYWSGQVPQSIIISKENVFVSSIIKPNVRFTGWKVSKYGVISGPYFPVFGLNTEIYGVNLCIVTPYLHTFHAVFLYFNCWPLKLKWTILSWPFYVVLIEQWSWATKLAMKHRIFKLKW